MLSFRENTHIAHISFLTRILYGLSGSPPVDESTEEPAPVDESTEAPAPRQQLYKGALAEGSRKVEKAAEAYKADALQGDNEATMRYAALLLSHGEEAVGLRLLEPFIKVGDLKAICTVGDYWYRWKKDKTKALFYYQMAARPETNLIDSAPWLITGRLLFEEGEAREAKRYLERVLDIEFGVGRWSGYAGKLLDRINEGLRPSL
jgi:tetratricopeptide (TPR) repeat protein